MNAREQDVVDAIRWWRCGTVTVLTRVINNIKGPSAWCPVLPPWGRERCARVPRSSRERVLRVLKGLVAQGIVTTEPVVWRLPVYALVKRTDSEESGTTDRLQGTDDGAAATTGAVHV